MCRIAVTNRRLCQGDFLTRVESLAKGDIYQAVLLREKDLTQEQYDILAKEVLNICQKYGKKCILHSFPEVAVRLGHPYLHLPLPLWQSLGGQEAVRIRQHIVEIGTSVHSQEQLKQAIELGADYVIAGHIFATDCKKGKAPRGLDFLQSICQETKIPVYGIGGINRENENAVLQAGAAGVCIMSGCMAGTWSASGIK